MSKNNQQDDGPGNFDPGEKVFFIVVHKIGAFEKKPRKALIITSGHLVDFRQVEERPPEGGASLLVWEWKISYISQYASGAATTYRRSSEIWGDIRNAHAAAVKMLQNGKL